MRDVIKSWAMALHVRYLPVHYHCVQSCLARFVGAATETYSAVALEVFTLGTSGLQTRYKFKPNRNEFAKEKLIIQDSLVIYTNLDGIQRRCTPADSFPSGGGGLFERPGVHHDRLQALGHGIARGLGIGINAESGGREAKETGSRRDVEFSCHICAGKG